MKLPSLKREKTDWNKKFTRASGTFGTTTKYLRSNMPTIRVPEGKEKEGGVENVSEEITAKISQIWQKI